MDYLIIPNKLNRPVNKHVILRHGLMNKLREKPWSGIFLSCPAGYGKSTLISQWLDFDPVDHYLWYSLDEYDNDFLVFLTYLTYSMGSFDALVGGKLESLLDLYGQMPEGSFIRMYMATFMQVTRKVTLILDDFHRIDDGRILAFVGQMLEFLEEKVQLVILSRAAIGLKLGKKRLESKILELNLNDLKLSDEEVQDLFGLLSGDSISSDQISAVMDLTDGWMTGLKLLLMTDKALVKNHLAHFASQENHPAIAQYFFEEIMSGMDRDLLIFLHLSHKPVYFSRKMCREVFEDFCPDARKYLDMVIEKNLFIIEGEGGLGTYHYHPLFKTMLEGYFSEALATGRLESIHGLMGAIGSWFEGQGQYYEAYMAYMTEGDFHRAAACLEMLWAPLDLQLKTNIWLEYIKHLPSRFMENRPVLLMAYGWSLMDNNQMERASIWFEKAQKAYEGYSREALEAKGMVMDQEQYDLFPIHMISAKAFMAGARGDLTQMSLYAKSALEYLDEGTVVKKFGLIMMIKAFTHWGMKDYGGAEEALEKAIHYEQQYGEAVNVDNFKMVLMSLWLHRGRYEMMDRATGQLIEAVENRQSIPMLLPTLYLLLAQSAYSRNNKESAMKHLKMARRLGNTYAIMDFEYRYHAFRARIYLEEGNLSEAGLYLHEARRLYFPNPIPDFDDLEVMTQKLEHKRQEAISIEGEGQKLVEPLTIRELEVLELIEAGLSNKEICDNLFLAISTVKGYNQNIFSKLGVRRRTEAVAKAKSLGIL